MPFCTAPCGSANGYFVARLIVKQLSAGLPLQFSAAMGRLATKSFDDVITAAYVAVKECFPGCFAGTYIEWDMVTFNGGTPPRASGGSIFGAAFLALAKLACELNPHLMPENIRCLSIDRVGITAAGDDCGYFQHVEPKSILDKLTALANLAAISIAVIPQNQGGVPWRNARHGEEPVVHKFQVEGGRSLPVIECSSGKECIERLFLLQARGLLLGGG